MLCVLPPAVTTVQLTRSPEATAVAKRRAIEARSCGTNMFTARVFVFLGYESMLARILCEAAMRGDVPGLVKASW